MLMKCLFRSVLRGDVVKPGRVLDLTEDECRMDVVKRFFVKVDGAEGAKSPSAAAISKASTKGAAKKPVVAGLTRDQAVMKLSQAGVKVKNDVSNGVLAEMYNTTFANAAEATSK